MGAPAWSKVSSASSIRIQVPRARAMARLRAAAKSTTVKSNGITSAPYRPAIDGVASVDPVSTTINSPARSRTASRHCGRLCSSFLTIMQRLSASGICGTPVSILQRSRADAENVDRVPQIPTHQRQAAVAIVAPADGHLLNAIAQPAGQHQDFNIEHIPVDLLPAENLPGRRAREKFEAALRVGNAFQAHHRMHEQPEALAAQLPVERLPLLDLRVPHGARAYDYIVALRRRCAQVRPELVELFDGYFVIGVRVTGDVATCQRHGLAHAAPLPGTLPVADHAHRLALPRGFES